MNELQQAIIAKGQSLGWEMSLYDPSKFSADQMLEIFSGCLAKIDVRKYAVPDMSVADMESIRLRLSEEAQYTPSDDDLLILESISPDNIIIRSMLEEVTCFFAATLESTEDLRKSMYKMEELMSIEISPQLRKVITIEFLNEGKEALITTDNGRFRYKVFSTESYTLFKNIGLTPLKLKKE